MAASAVSEAARPTADRGGRRVSARDGRRFNQLPVWAPERRSEENSVDHPARLYGSSQVRDAAGFVCRSVSANVPRDIRRPCAVRRTATDGNRYRGREDLGRQLQNRACSSGPVYMSSRAENDDRLRSERTNADAAAKREFRQRAGLAASARPRITGRPTPRASSRR